MEGFIFLPPTGWPTHSATPAKLQVAENIRGTVCQIFQTFIDSCRLQKSIKMSPCFKTLPNLTHLNKWRPSVRGLLDAFWSFIFHKNLRSATLLNCNTYHSNTVCSPLRALPFRIKFQSYFHILFQAPLLLATFY